MARTAPRVQSVAKSNSDEMFPGLEEDLMKKADEIENQVREQDMARTAPKKKLAAVAESKDSRKDRAARFFATHGMKDIGSMLGDTMSASAETQAIQQAKAQRQRLADSVGRSFQVPSVVSSASEKTDSSMSMDDDIPLDDEDDMKKRWKAVDALRMHHR